MARHTTRLPRYAWRSRYEWSVYFICPEAEHIYSLGMKESWPWNLYNSLWYADVKEHEPTRASTASHPTV